MNRTRTQSLVHDRSVPVAHCRYATWLRSPSLLLSLCCFWSFAGSGIAIAAVSSQKKTMGRSVPHSFPLAPAFRATPSAFTVAAAALHSTPTWTLTQVAPVVARPKSSASLGTVLDEVGHFIASRQLE